MEFAAPSRKKSWQVALTPLIDVVFLLIIFFLMTSHFSNIGSIELSFSGVRIETEDGGASLRPLAIRIEANGGLHFGGREVSGLEMTALLREKLAEFPNQPVVIFTESQTPVQNVVSLMDQVYLAGGRQVSVTQASP